MIMVYNLNITDNGNSVIALCLLASLLPDTRSKPDADKVVVFTHHVSTYYYSTINACIEIFPTPTPLIPI